MAIPYFEPLRPGVLVVKIPTAQFPSVYPYLSGCIMYRHGGEAHFNQGGNQFIVTSAPCETIIKPIGIESSKHVQKVCKTIIIQ